MESEETSSRSDEESKESETKDNLVDMMEMLDEVMGSEEGSKEVLAGVESMSNSDEKPPRLTDMPKTDHMKMMAMTKAKESLVDMMRNSDLTEDDFAMENESLEDSLVDEQLGEEDSASSDELNDGYKLVMDIIIEEVLEDEDE